MKRVLSLVLALVLVLGMVPVFANTVTAEEAFAALEAYEFVTGDENGDPMMDKVLTRQEMAKIYATIKGVGPEAEAFEGDVPYADADEIHEWAEGYVAYAYDKMWMVGDGTNFGPTDAITGEQLLIVLLRVVTEDTEVGRGDRMATVQEEAVALGLPVFSMGAITRAEVFQTVFTAVAEIENEDGLTLVQEMGLAPLPTPDVLEVVSVSADNLMQVVVEFNMDVEENEEVADVDNYDLDAEDIKAVDVEGNMAVLTLDANVAQQKMAELTISNKVLAEETIEEFQFLDTTMPTAISAEVVGEKTIKFTYSEPVAEPDKSNFSIDGGSLFIDDIEMLNNNTEANVTLYSVLEEGSLSVKTTGVEDFAGFSILSATFQVQVVEDDEAPFVIGFKDAKPTEVTLIFNEEVRLNGTENLTKYYHTNANSTASDIEIDGNELTIKFADDDKMSPGSSYVYIMKEQLTDLWSNKNAQVMFQVDVELDVVSPEVKSHKVTSETTLEVVFTEDVTEDTMEDQDNYKLLFEGEEEDFIKDITYSSATKATIEFTKKLAGDYVLVIENVEDIAGNEIAATSVGFTVEDMTAPKFEDFEVVGYKLGAKGQLVKVNFGEKMAVDGAYSVNDLDKYIVNGTALTDLELAATITVVDNGQAIEIRIPSVADDTDTDDDDDGFNLPNNNSSIIQIARVADAAGNKTVKLSETKTINQADFVKYTVEQTGAKTFVVKFTEKLSNFDAGDFKVYADQNEDGTATEVTAIASRSIAVVKNKTEVTYTLANALNTDTDVSKLYVQAIATVPSGDNADKTETENVYGQTVKLGTKVATDKAAPVLLVNDTTDAVRLAVETTSRVILVEFTENLKVVNLDLLAQEFVVTMDGDVLVAGAHFDYTVLIINNDTIQITINNTVDHADEVTVATKGSITYISDAAGNKVAPIKAVTLEVVPAQN